MSDGSAQQDNDETRLSHGAVLVAYTVACKIDAACSWLNWQSASHLQGSRHDLKFHFGQTAAESTCAASICCCCSFL